MENQNEGKDWNERWLEQIEEWQLQRTLLLIEAELLAALIELAQSQIKIDPPE